MSNANVQLIQDNLSPEDYNYQIVSCRRQLILKILGQRRRSNYYKLSKRTI